MPIPVYVTAAAPYLARAGGGVPGYTYAWSPPAGLSSTTDSTVTATPLSTITYTVTSTSTGGCSATASVNVGIGQSGRAGIAAAVNDTICSGSAVDLRTSGSSGNVQWQYSLTGTTFFNLPGATDTFYTGNIIQTSYFRVIGGAGACGDTSQTIEIVLNPLPPAPVLAPSDSIICSNDSVQVCAAGGPFAGYLWNTGETGSCIEVKAAGGYWLTATSANGCTVTSSRAEIEVYPVSPVSITVKGDTLTSFNAVSYQWYRNGVPITGASSAMYVAPEGGAYSVQIVDTNGCSTRSSDVVISGIDEARAENIRVFPNPGSGNWQLITEANLIGSQLEVYTTDGRLVYQSEIQGTHTFISFKAASGVYLLHIATGQGGITRKLVNW